MLNKKEYFVALLDDYYRSPVIRIEKTTTEVDFSIEYQSKNKTCNSEAKFVINVQKKMIVPMHKISTRIFWLSPKFIFQNKTVYQLIIFQSNCPESKQISEPGTETSFFWYDKVGVKTVQVGLHDTLMTEDFRIDDTGPIVQQMTRIDNSFSEILRIERIMHRGVHYIEISCETAEKPHYMIYNSCRNITVAYKQTGADVNYRYLDANSIVPFGWVNQNNEHNVHLIFCWGTLQSGLIQYASSDWSHPMEDIAKSNSTKIELTHKKGKYVWVSLEYDGCSNILKISDTENDNLMQVTRKFNLSVEIEGIGISLTTTQLGKAIELLYTSMKQIQFAIIEKDHLEDIYISIQKFQIDNQSKQNPAFPAVLYANFMEEKRGNTDPFLRFGCQINKSLCYQGKFYNFDFIKLSILPFTLKLEEDLLTALYEFYESVELKKTLRRESANDSPKEVFKFSQTPSGTESQNEDINLYIQSFIVSFLRVTVWYKSCLNSNKAKNSNTILRALASTFLNLEEQVVTFQRIKSKKVNSKAKNLLLNVATEYANSLRQQSLEIIASFLFSNIKDIRHIGAGFTDILRKESSNGERSGGFIKNAIVGTFGVASKLSAKASKGVLAFSNDQEYFKEMQKKEEMVKANNILEGVSLGVYSAVTSIGSGIYGIFSKPVEGAMSGGIGGFCKVKYKNILIIIGDSQRINWGDCKAN